MEKSFLNQRGQISYSGLTKFATTENISTGVQQHRLRFQDVPLPEGLFIVALPKTALSGEFKRTTMDARVFAKHNIQQVEF